MAKTKYTKKERNLFFAGALLGITAGFVGSVAVTAMYRLIDRDYSLHNITVFIAAFVIYIGLCWFLFKQIKK